LKNFILAIYKDFSKFLVEKEMRAGKIEAASSKIKL
jgi:hypothetical protein